MEKRVKATACPSFIGQTRKKYSGKTSTTKSVRHTLHSLSEIQEMTRTQIYYYVERLHKLVRKQSRQLKKYKEMKRKIKYRDKVRKLNDTERGKEEESVPSTAEGDAMGKGATALDVERLECTCHRSRSNPTNIVDEIKEAAEHAVNQLGFVYEPTSGLYYDCKTGYYYNSEQGLYYDGNTGIYYKYNQEEKKFEFYSQAYVVEPESSNQNIDVVNDIDVRPVACPSQTDVEPNGDREDGELSSDNEPTTLMDISENTENVNCIVDNTGNDNGNGSGSGGGDNRQLYTNNLTEYHESVTEHIYEDVARKYPPSLRITVLETNLCKLKIGELFMITYKGGSLGREGSHDVIIPDINVSKYHLKFTYNETKSMYECVDLGSRNGTILNGKRISNAKQESEPMEIVHGSMIQIAQTKLLCHIHDGHLTCEQCEPGLNAAPPAYEVIDVGETAAAAAARIHKEEIKRLKKRYGLADQKFLIQQRTKNDRAAKRRKEVGSSHSNEKTAAASVDSAINVENKGFKMLTKLGWNQGQALGKTQQGIAEPIPLVSNEGTRGLGCDEPTNRIDKKTAKKTRQLQITQERYNTAVAHSQDIFENDGVSD